MRSPAPKRTVRAGRAQAQRKRLFFAPESIALCPSGTGAKAFFPPLDSLLFLMQPPLAIHRLSACPQSACGRQKRGLGHSRALPMPRQPQGPFAVIALQPDSAPSAPFAPRSQALNRLLAQSEGPPCADQHKPSFLCPFSTARLARGSLAKSIRTCQKEERIPAGKKAVCARSIRTSCYGSRSGFRRVMKAPSAGLGLA